MFSYDDVITGRLLLHDGAVGLPGLWAALRLVSQGGGRLDFREALARGPLGTSTGQRVLERAAENVAVVLQVEEDRTLARLIHLEQSVPDERIRTLYAYNRAQGFRESLASLLRREGLLTADHAARLAAQVQQHLSPARRGRAHALTQLAHTLAARYGPHEGERVREVFELSLSGAQRRPEPGSRTQSEQTAGVPAMPQQSGPQHEEGAPHPNPGQPSPSPHPIEDTDPDIETPDLSKHEPLAAAARQGEELRPEDCPIYGYEIVKELGKGSMGVVYKARNIFSGKVTALKILPLRLAAKTQYLERFKREAMALMRIDHPNVVRGYDFGGSEDYYYLALEFIEGEPLDELLGRVGKLSERQALEITRQVALGLGAADEHGVIHRDIKPENVMLTREGSAKICDFGIVKLTDMSENSVTMAGTTVGTPFYISPEQARGEEDLDIRSDIYSLGISLFHLTTGQVPFTGRSQGAILVRHILEEVPDPRTVNPALSEATATLILRMCRKKREERHQSADELAAAIEELLQGLPA